MTKQNKTAALNIRLTQKEKQEATVLAAKQYRSLSSLVCQALGEYIKKHNSD